MLQYVCKTNIRSNNNNPSKTLPIFLREIIAMQKIECTIKLYFNYLEKMERV